MPLPVSLRFLPAVLACCVLLATAAQGQFIRVVGNGTEITAGDSTPSTADHTDFGNVDVSSGVADRTFTVQNLGFSSLFLYSVQRVGGASGDFTNIPPNYAQILPPQTQTTFTVRFNPTLPGIRSTTVRITNNSTNAFTFDFTIRGNGTLPAPEINVQGNGLNISDGDPIPSAADHTDFGEVDLGGEGLSRTFMIQNTGDLPLEISSLQSLGINPTLFTISGPLLTSVPAGFQVPFTVTYLPDTSGFHSATIRINNNDANESTYDFVVQGIGVNRSPEIEVRGNNIVIAPGDTTPDTNDGTNFGSVALDAPAVGRTFAITNTGVLDLVISSIEFFGGNSSDFLLSPPTVSTIPAGTTSTFTVRFDPTALGRRSTTLRLASNDPATPSFDFAIHGFGGSFQLLRVERDSSDAVIVFFVNPDPAPSTYIYSLQASSQLASNTWTTIQGLNTPGGVGERSFRVANAFGPKATYWRITETALP